MSDRRSSWFPSALAAGLAAVVLVAVTARAGGPQSAPASQPGSTSQPTAASQPAGYPTLTVEALQPLVQQRLDAFREELGFPGATCAVVMPSGRHIAVATGVSHKASQTPMRPTDLMLAGSVGKTFVAAIVLQLVDEGRLELDAPIARWLDQEPWFARLPNADQITLRMLLNHTSGLPEYFRESELLSAVRAAPDRTWKPEELIGYVLGNQPLFAAGQGWSYADTNYILAGMIIERATGHTYYQELIGRLQRPLRLRDTRPSDRITLPGLVSGYTAAQNLFSVPEEVATDGRCAINPQMEWTGGGVLSTSLDLARWAHELYGGAVLKPETRSQMLTGVPAKPLGADHAYGLGVIIRPSPRGPVYGHSGWSPGYVTMVGFYANPGLGIAVQVNTDTGVSAAALERLLDDVASTAVPR